MQKHQDKVIKTEIDLIKKNISWTLVDFPEITKSIAFNWIFKKIFILINPKKKNIRKLVRKCFTQKPNINYFDTFDPVT